ncbi:hypothetical protein EAH89_11520 [Roseomonas nepalensis]|uniref:DUF5666 domain-containing protein n=1 Tax=Muricoccus nepalensis TaxID=1854500 RepID=A0A502G8L1_9PROT|nr:hypothetical protein EAH89_11520 [Roseomonas nepalensis]
MLLAAALVLGAGGALAVAQGRNAPRDPASMPEFRGRVAQYSLTPVGDVDGLILADGTEVHFPPHLGEDVQRAVHPGDEVVIRGERNGPVLLAGSIAANGTTVTDKGPPAGGPRRPPGPGGSKPADPALGRDMDAAGVVKMALHGPAGELNGALLENGTMIHLPPRDASRLADLLKPGQTLAVKGWGLENAVGRAIDARQAGPSMDRLVQLSVPPRPLPPVAGTDEPGAPAAAGDPAAAAPRPPVR